jgi:hypothetical protein
MSARDSYTPTAACGQQKSGLAPTRLCDLSGSRHSIIFVTPQTQAARIQPILPIVSFGLRSEKAAAYFGRMLPFTG